ncbi:hypothetical protein C8R45DRAFT_1183546 [Mycena sanguinolenta]|nr:hypothetical protein C8R45DRAFT_1183546 [Mycena sanguinolenta]
MLPSPPLKLRNLHLPVVDGTEEEAYANREVYDDCDVPLGIVSAHLLSSVETNFAVGDNGGITRSGNAEAEDEDNMPPVLGRGQRKKVPTRRYQGPVLGGALDFFLPAGIGCVAVMFIHPQSIFMNRSRSFIILAGINKAFGAGADAIATIAMCMFLKSADTGMNRRVSTSSLLRSLMHLVINRGLLVTFGQTLMLILFFTSTGHLYWVAVHINTTKLYVNTFFAMLNARASILDAYSPHISKGGLSSVRTETVVRRESSHEFQKFSGLDIDNFGMDAIKVTTTSTVAEM